MSAEVGTAILIYSLVWAAVFWWGMHDKHKHLSKVIDEEREWGHGIAAKLEEAQKQVNDLTTALTAERGRLKTAKFELAMYMELAEALDESDTYLNAVIQYYRDVLKEHGVEHLILSEEKEAELCSYEGAMEYLEQDRDEQDG